MEPGVIGSLRQAGPGTQGIPPALGSQMFIVMPSFYRGAGDPNSGPHAHVVGTLPANSPLQQNKAANENPHEHYFDFF